MNTTDLTSADQVAVRVLHDEDTVELARIAALDSSRLPRGRILGAEVDGSLVAAISLNDGHTVADPFHRTSNAVELLAVRAKQVRGEKAPSRLKRVLDALGRGNAHAGLAGSPPGAGGRLLQL